MSFSSKNITQTTTRGISFLKGATLFFLGMSLVLFVTKAFEVVPTTQNFVSYFQKMFLTPDGFNLLPETISLDGVAGDASFAGTVTGDTVAADTLCLTSDSCITTWTGGGGSASAAGNTTNIQFNGGSANFSGSDDFVWDSTNGRLGIGTTTPRGQLDIVGSSNNTFLFTSNRLGAPGAMVLINSDTTTKTGLLIGQNGSDVAINNYDGILSIGTKGNIGLNINASGNVGVNRELSVSYTGTFSQNLFIDGGNLLFGQGEKYIHLPIRTAGIGGNIPGHHLSIKAGDSSDNSAAPTSGGNLYLQGGDVSSPGGGGFYPPGNEQGGNVYIDGGGGAGIYGNVLLAYSGGMVGIHTSDPTCGISNACGFHVENKDSYFKGELSVVYGDMGVGYDIGNSTLSGNLYVLNNVGIGTTGPTERLQVGSKAWIGSRSFSCTTANSSTGGEFLRIQGSGPSSCMVPSVSNPYPNIQLNYYNTSTSNDRNRKINNNGNLGFEYATGNFIYDSKMSISSIGNLELTSGATIYGTTAYTSRQIFLAGNGYVGIGKNGPSTRLDVNGDVKADAYYYSSDQRLKTDIVAITNPLEKILALNGYLFTWKETGRRDMGVIAQEVEQIFPEIIHTNNEGYKSVEYGNLVAPLIEAIKELNAKVEQQAQEIAELKNIIQ